MAVRQINTADFDYAMMLESINKSYKGKADITIDEFDTTAAPDVKVGSVWDNNGAILILESADMTPTGYAGIANSTPFYLYYDESGEVFIYSSTEPVWNDALQGYYNGNDRAFFSMFKDSGGTLYKAKTILEGAPRLLTKIIPIGDWDIDTDVSKEIPHGLPDYTKIRGFLGIIRNDADTLYNDMLSVNATPSTSWIRSDAIGNLSLRASDYFNNSSYSATSYNRGWVTIRYIG